MQGRILTKALLPVAARSGRDAAVNGVIQYHWLCWLLLTPALEADVSQVAGIIPAILMCQHRILPCAKFIFVISWT